MFYGTKTRNKQIINAPECPIFEESLLAKPGGLRAMLGKYGNRALKPTSVITANLVAGTIEVVLASEI